MEKNRCTITNDPVTVLKQHKDSGIKVSQYDYIVELYKNNKLLILSQFTDSKSKVTFECQCCKHIFQATPLSKKQAYSKIVKNEGEDALKTKYLDRGIGCPNCSLQSNKLNYNQMFEKRGVECIDNKKIQPDDLKSTYRFACNGCGHEWKTTPFLVYHAQKRKDYLSGCPECDQARDNRYFTNKKNASSRFEDVKQQLREKNNILLIGSIVDKLSNKMEVQCGVCDNKWRSAPLTLLREYDNHGRRGCPECARAEAKVRASGTKMTSDQIQQLKDDLLENNKLVMLEEFTGMKKHVLMKCTTCDHEWKTTPISKIQSFKKYGSTGCPKCAKRRQDQHKTDARATNIQILKERGIEVLSADWDGRRDYNGSNLNKITVKNKKCNHTFQATPNQLLSRGVNCAVCGPQTRTYALTAWSKRRSEEWRKTAEAWQIYKSEVGIITERNYNKNKHVINPDNLSRGVAGTAGVYQIDHIVPKRICFEYGIPAEVCSDIKNLQMISWEENNAKSNTLPTVVPELFLDYLPKEAFKQTEWAAQIEMWASDKTQVELCATVGSNVVTALFPEHNHVFHVIQTDEIHENSPIASDIINYCLQNNLTWTVCFQDEFENNTDLVLSRLNHVIRIDNVRVEYARNCFIREIDSPTKREFLEKFHVQGNDKSVIKYGAFTKGDKLVAVMTFSKPRITNGFKNRNGGEWELTRFATDTNIRVIGIGSKMLSHFKNNNVWTNIVSYSDLRWGVGKTYEKLGFTLEKTTTPGYWYMVDGERRHRWEYRKDRLKNVIGYDEKLTETEIMKNLGYWKVRDAGHYKFTLENPNGN